MPRSAVDICNLALNHIGQRAISALTESSNEARKCSLVYEAAKEETLRAHDWNFTTKIEALAKITGESTPGFSFVYARPSNCLYIRKIYNDATIDTAMDNEYKEVRTNISNQKAIAANIDSAYIEFTMNISDPNDFDSSFVMAFSYKLASLISKPLTGDDKKMAMMDAKFKESVSDAKRVNASERNPKPRQVSSYEDVR